MSVVLTGCSRETGRHASVSHGRGGSLARRVIAGVLLLAACEADSTLVSEGKYVRYLASDGLHACAGTPALLDDFVPFVAGELGMSLPPRVDYHWLTDDAYARTDCPAETSACAGLALVYSTDPLLRHELVHSVGAANGMAGGLPFFKEGLASAYDHFSSTHDSRYSAGFWAKPSDPRPQMLLSWADLDYAVADGFVSFLLARHGPEKLVAISQRSREGDDLDALRGAFRATYGIELDDEAELYMRAGELGCEDDSFAVRPHDCTMPEVAWSGQRWAHAGRMDCEADDVAGSYQRSTLRSVTLEVPTTGQFVVRVSGTDRAEALVGRCFGCPWQHADLILSADRHSEQTTTLEAGPHFVRMYGDADAAPLVTVTIRPVE